MDTDLSILQQLLPVPLILLLSQSTLDLITMQLSLAFVALLGFVSTSLAAPAATVVTRDTSLVARGRIRDQLRDIRHDAHELKCKIKQAFKCFNHEVDYHLKAIKSDLHQDFHSWKLDVKYDFDLWREQLCLDIVDFEIKYAEFKAHIDSSIQYCVDTAVSTVVLAEWDIRFHLAYIWERLALLESDRRSEVYESLRDWSVDLHSGCNVDYKPYPAGCGSVLLQIETIQQYYRSEIDITTYNDKLVSIHKQIYEYTSTSTTTTYTQVGGYHGVETPGYVVSETTYYVPAGCATKYDTCDTAVMCHSPVSHHGTTCATTSYKEIENSSESTYSETETEEYCVETAGSPPCPKKGKKSHKGKYNN